MKLRKNCTLLRTVPIFGPGGEFDYKFCSDPIIYFGEQNGQHLYCYPANTRMGKYVGDGTRILPTAYLDVHWESVFDIMNGEEWPVLQSFSGKHFYRKKPVMLHTSNDERYFDFSFDVTGLKLVTYDHRFVGEDKAVIVLAATKHHLVVLDEKNEIPIFLDEPYVCQDDWVMLD